MNSSLDRRRISIYHDAASEEGMDQITLLIDHGIFVSQLKS